MGVTQLSSNEHCSSGTTCIQVDLWILLTICIIGGFFITIVWSHMRKQAIVLSGSRKIAPDRDGENKTALARDSKASVVVSRNRKTSQDAHALWQQRRQVSQKALLSMNEKKNISFFSRIFDFWNHKKENSEREDELFQKPSYEQRRRLSITAETDRAEMDNLKTEQNTKKRRVSVSKNSKISFKVEDKVCEVYEVIVGEINLVRQISTSPVCEVYCATWRDTEVAVKILVPQDTCVDNLSEVIMTFRREIFIMEKLNHPNILHLIGISLSSSCYIIVMEYMHNGMC